MSYDPRQLPSWSKLNSLQVQFSSTQLLDLFAEDPERVSKFSFAQGDLWLDLSKNHWDSKVLKALVQLADEAGLAQKRDEMFAGEAINRTEGRAVLHTALRDPASKLHIQGQDVHTLVQTELDKMRVFCNKVHSGQWLGHNGKPIRYIINIGIGGSDLGPKMVVKALTPYGRENFPQAIFVSNVDGAHLKDALDQVNLDECLFVIASKTFTTLETMTNAQEAKSALIQYFGGETSAVAKHFVALSTNTKAVVEFGIDPLNMFQFWDWVGGRLSLWSAIGLSIALSYGYDVFAQLLEGAHAMDRHFVETPLEQNWPVLLGLLGIWQTNFLGYESHAVLPYAEHLEYFPAFLQQLDMESNGKGVTVEGRRVTWSTGPIVWGEPGTNGQHAFYQLLHQGTRRVSTDFILPIQAHHQYSEHQLQLISNCLAQTQALMQGKSAAVVKEELLAGGIRPEDLAVQVAPRVFEGNRPSTTLLMQKLTPVTLGQLIALYEHKIFVQGVIWGVNSFDQFGVELGKVLAKGIAKDLRAGAPRVDQDPSTFSLLTRILTVPQT